MADYWCLGCKFALMHQPPDILMMAYKQPVMQDQMILLQEKERQIPGSVQYMIKRYHKQPQWSMDDTGMMVYHYRKNEPAQNYLELRFCIAGNTYCSKKEIECDSCKLSASPGCTERIDTVDVLSFRFLAVHLSQFAKPVRKQEAKPGDSPLISDEILHFRHSSSFSKILALCGRTRMLLEALLNHSFTGSLENIYINAQSQMLLLYSPGMYAGGKAVIPEAISVQISGRTKPIAKRS